MPTEPIDVVMPVYNAERYLVGAVSSILSQTYRKFRLICIDDGSTDQSADILHDLAAQDSRLVVIHQSNQGITSALNRGLAICNAPLIARMDADDIAMPTRFQQQVDYLQVHPEVVAVGSAILEVDADNDPLAVQTFASSHDQITSGLLQVKTGLAHPAAMIRRQALELAGGYNKDFEGVEDVDLWFRLAQVGQLANLPNILLCYRQHAASICWAKNPARNQKLVRLLEREYKRRGIELPQALVKRCLESRSNVSPMKWARRAARNGQWKAAIKHFRSQWRTLPFSPLTWRMSAEVAIRLAMNACTGRRTQLPDVPDCRLANATQKTESRAA